MKGRHGKYSMLAKVSASVVQPIVDRLKLSVRIGPKDAWCAIGMSMPKFWSGSSPVSTIRWRRNSIKTSSWMQGFFRNWPIGVQNSIVDTKSGYHGSMATVLKVEKTESWQAGYRQGIKDRVCDDEARRSHYLEPPTDYYGGGY
jgi:hypothetical protein